MTIIVGLVFALLLSLRGSLSQSPEFIVLSVVFTIFSLVMDATLYSRAIKAKIDTRPQKELNQAMTVEAQKLEQARLDAIRYEQEFQIYLRRHK